MDIHSHGTLVGRQGGETGTERAAWVLPALALGAREQGDSDTPNIYPRSLFLIGDNERHCFSAIQSRRTVSL